MISIPIDSFDSYTAKPMTKDHLTLGLKIAAWVIGILITICLVLVGMLWDITSDRFKSIDSSLSQIYIVQKAQGELLARLDERTKPLEYKKRAFDSGFTNKAHIVKADFQSKKFVTTNAGENVEDFVQYTFENYDPITKTLTLLMNGRIGSIVLRNNGIGIKVEVGQVIEIPTMVQFKGPKLFIQILDVPTPNQAILAVGPKSDESNKPS